MKPRDADAIAQGQTREFDELSLGGVVFFDATIKSPGPVLTAFKRYPVTLDLERTRVYWERPNAGATTGAVFGVILGVAAAAAGIGALVYLMARQCTLPGDAYVRAGRCLQLIERALQKLNHALTEIRIGAGPVTCGTPSLARRGPRLRRHPLLGKNVRFHRGHGLGADRTRIVRTRIFVTDISRWTEYDPAHAEFFGEHRPTTSMFEVKQLIDPAMLIEIAADAIDQVR